MLTLVLLLLALTAPQDTSAPQPAARCQVDPKFVELGFEAFDQEENGGWRAMVARGCAAEAADMIREYRFRYQAILPALTWHEAQVRAESGEVDAAVALMETARKPATEDSAGWNPYVDATIAFLKKDRAAFLDAKQRLERVARPVDLPADADWPPNANVVDGLDRCFDQPYAKAHGTSCPSSRARR